PSGLPDSEAPAPHLAGFVPAIIVDESGLAGAVDVARHEADAFARDPAAAAGHDRREPPAVDDEAAPLVDHLDHLAFRRQTQVITVPVTDLARSIDAVGAGRTGGKRDGSEQQAGEHTVHRRFSFELDSAARTSLCQNRHAIARRPKITSPDRAAARS